jgi:eukaryotic-like serine/threonine-protein kinase
VSDTWARVSELFERVHHLPAQEREAWLRSECADEALAAEVLSLLRIYDEDPGFLERPVPSEVIATAFDTSTGTAAVGQRLGPYRLIEEIGHGGMGTVFLAERDDEQLARRVAIKVIASSFAPVFLRRQFGQERQILAALDHPFIARLIDVGATAEGLPFLIMELVEGVPIDRYCADHALTVRGRLQLMLDVCSAVEYAHRHFVVHRDLKPSNILVTADGTPKLLDFGIATLIDPARTRAGDPSAIAGRLLTPECASPEQVLGLPVSAATDVYALGVLLYRLLTGQSPYGDPGARGSTLLRAVCETDPRLPSDVVMAADPPTPARRRELRGDLDRIALRALSKKAEHRYSSVERFADDISRHLEDRPVLAAPDSVVYRGRKFVRRHTMGVAAAAVVAIAIVAGAGVSLYQTRIARRERAVAQQRFDMVRRLADTVILDFGDALGGAPESIASRKRIVALAIEYLDSLALQPEADAGLLRQLAASYLRIGRLQGDPTKPNLGDTAGALASYERALAAYTRLAKTANDAATRAGIADVRGAIGLYHWTQGNPALARSHFDEMRRLFDQLARDDPGNQGYRRGVAGADYLIGQAWLREGNELNARRSFRQSVATYETVLAATSDDYVSQRGLAIAYLKLGDTAMQLRDDDARAWYGKAIGAFEALGKSASARDTPRLTALTWLRLAESVIDTNRARAESAARRALVIVKPLAERDPLNVQAHDDLGYAYLTLGSALPADLRRLPAREDALVSAVRELRSVMSANPGFADARRELAFALRRLGDVLVRRGDAASALKAYREAVPLLETSGISNQDEELGWLYRSLGAAYAQAAETGEDAGASATALAWYRKSARQWDLVAKKHALARAEAGAQREVNRLISASRPRPSSPSGR